MITIKEFAKLCSCNAQTLRYYDRINLLKPVRVDEWTGYRYYSRSQAIDFIKIKNLQRADFSIEEIKRLLGQTDQEVYAAFERKIAEQKEKLSRILEIQQTYLNEKKAMEKIIHGLSDYLVGQIGDPEILTEFGLAPADGERLLAKLQSYIEENVSAAIDPDKEMTLTVNETVFSGTDAIMDKIQVLSPEDMKKTIILANEDTPETTGFEKDDFELLFERHGWKHVSEFVDSVPTPESGREYCFCFELTDQKFCQDASFGFLMLGAILCKKGADKAILGCDVKESTDQTNHFRLMRKK